MMVRIQISIKRNLVSYIKRGIIKPSIEAVLCSKSFENDILK